METNLPFSNFGAGFAWLSDSKDEADADEETVENDSVEDEVVKEEIFEDELEDELVESAVSPLARPSFFIVAVISQPDASLSWT